MDEITKGNYFDFFAEAIPSKRKYLIVVIYDISDNKRRTKLGKLLESYGFRVQKSCFECRLTPSKYKSLLEEVNPYIGKEDLLRIYKILNVEDVVIFGDRIYEDLEDTIII
ncbi:hypothetical protein MASR2M70_16450 [Bacillota bacterium]